MLTTHTFVRAGEDLTSTHEYQNFDVEGIGISFDSLGSPPSPTSGSGNLTIGNTSLHD